MACGFEPPGIDAFAWRHQGYDVGRIDPETGRGEREPLTCPGYTTKLPEVCEAADLYFERKELAIDRQLRPAALAAVKAIALEALAMQGWLMRNPRKD